MPYVSYTCCVVHYPSVTGKHTCRVYKPVRVCLSFCLSFLLFWRINVFIIAIVEIHQRLGPSERHRCIRSSASVAAANVL